MRNPLLPLSTLCAVPATSSFTSASARLSTDRGADCFSVSTWHSDSTDLIGIPRPAHSGSVASAFGADGWPVRDNTAVTRLVLL